MRKTETYFSEETILLYLAQIALAVQELHSQRILHRDLKVSLDFAESLAKSNHRVLIYYCTHRS